MKKLLTIAQVSTLLGMSPKSIRQRVYRRQIPFRRWGSRILFLEDEVAEFIQSLPGIGPDEAERRVDGYGAQGSVGSRKRTQHSTGDR